MLETLNKYYEDGWLIKQTHPTLPLTIWNYSQTTQYEGKWDEVTLQCRGLVTDTDGNVVARPFKKFFNMEEEKHTETEEYEVYEKMDGSLGIAFYMVVNGFLPLEVLLLLNKQLKVVRCLKINFNNLTSPKIQLICSKLYIQKIELL